MSWRIIGLGSPFGDDAAGWQVVERLKDALAPGGMAELVMLDRPSVGLLPYLSGVEGAILVDAMQSGQPPGTLQRLSLDQAERLPASLSSHGFGLGETLRLAQVLGALPSQLEIYGIELGQLDGEGLSPDIEQAVKVLAGELAARFTPTPRAQPR